MKPISGQWVVVYGPRNAPRVYATVYTYEDVVVQTGYARRRHPAPGDDVRAAPAKDIPVDMTTT